MVECGYQCCNTIGNNSFFEKIRVATLWQAFFHFPLYTSPTLPTYSAYAPPPDLFGLYLPPALNLLGYHLHPPDVQSIGKCSAFILNHRRIIDDVVCSLCVLRLLSCRAGWIWNCVWGMYGWLARMNACASPTRMERPAGNSTGHPSLLVCTRACTSIHINPH